MASLWGSSGYPLLSDQGKAHSHLWNWGLFGEEQVWETGDIRGQKELLTCKQGLVIVLTWPCPVPVHLARGSLRAHGCGGVWVVATGVGPELTGAMCLWATAGGCEDACASTCHQQTSGGRPIATCGKENTQSPSLCQRLSSISRSLKFLLDQIR